MIENVLLLVLSVGTIVVMTLILSWFFRRLSRIEDEHWAEMAGESTPRWARFLVGKKEVGKAAKADAAAEETESG
ncbi:MAG: hypothetical protein ISS31_07995 [Kiritimatiellae bacterium]|nr:hypothetical protein [Kiritimatiellia bacterium]